MADTEADREKQEGYLTGQLLIAMPTMGDQRFARAVIYVCAHSSDGAMGLVVNKGLPSVDPAELLDQLGIEEAERPASLRIQFGGPVESGRGFVLHTTDFEQDGTLVVDRNEEGGVAMTATLDILRAIAKGEGPGQHILVLGYAGWGPGQLDGEIQENGWLSVPPDQAILFDEDLSTKWERAIAKLGFSPHMLSTDAGHA